MIKSEPVFLTDIPMLRPPRIQFAGANYHIITRGDGRRPMFHDNGHYERFTKGLQDEVQRSGWIVLAYCWMPNHIHCLLQTLSLISLGECNIGFLATPTGMQNETNEGGIFLRAGTKRFWSKMLVITGR